jgi:MFS family permease
MMRIFILLLLIIIASFIGGIYGALYDQITYAISPEFFSKFRFERFNIDPDMNERIGAAMVGFKNTWKTGMILGAVLALAGLINADYKKMFRYTMRAFLITLAIAFIAGLTGWLVGFPDMHPDPATELNIIDKDAFKTVENMNNFSYAGGVIGMFVGIFLQLYQHKKYKAKTEAI